MPPPPMPPPPMPPPPPTKPSVGHHELERDPRGRAGAVARTSLRSGHGPRGGVGGRRV
jgi:hypothetical protein